MRPVSEWDQTDLQSLIDNGVPESLTLDYKNSLALSKDDGCRTELSKDVSAFANSTGGVIVYGIDEDNHLPSKMDEGVDPKKITREWLEQVIGSTIKPRVQGVIIRQIALDSGKVAYAIEIPAATTFAPHQANDHRYYKRFNFLSRSMEDYEVRDIQKRASTPSLFLEFGYDGTEYLPQGPRGKLRLDLCNNSPEPALYSTVLLYIDNHFLANASAEFQKREGTLHDGKKITVFQMNLAVPHQQPIYKENKFTIGYVSFDKIENNEFGFFGFKVTCPGFCSERLGTMSFNGESVDIRWFP